MHEHAEHFMKCANVCADCQLHCDSCFNRISATLSGVSSIAGAAGWRHWINGSLTRHRMARDGGSGWARPRRMVSAATFATFAAAGMFSTARVQQFAKEQGVSAGIIVGRLQFEGHISFANLNGLKVKYTWNHDKP